MWCLVWHGNNSRLKLVSCKALLPHQVVLYSNSLCCPLFIQTLYLQETNFSLKDVGSLVLLFCLNSISVQTVCMIGICVCAGIVFFHVQALNTHLQNGVSLETVNGGKMEKVSHLSFQYFSVPSCKIKKGKQKVHNPVMSLE